MLALALWTGTALAIDCPERLTREDLSAELDKAETAYADLDTMAFRDRMNGMAGLVLPCMGDLVPPELAARTHRAMALQQLELSNPDAAAVAIAAAHAADPHINVPEGWLPPDHPLRTALAAAPEAAFGKAPEPRVGALAFDGVSGRARPKDFPTVVQVFDTAGTAVSTAYLGPDDHLPAYDAIPRKRNTLIVGSAGSGAVGLSLLAASWLQYRGLLAAAADQSTPPEDLTAMRGPINTLYVAGGAMIGLSVGLGVGAAVVGPQ